MWDARRAGELGAAAHGSDLFMALNEAGALPRLSLSDPSNWPAPAPPRHAG